MEKFLSCDWGTSSFRLRLINTDGLKVLAEQRSAEGIAATYALWNENRSGHDRFHFYISVIQAHVAAIEKNLNISLKDIPVIISGMASSSMGMIELPYKRLPFLVSGADLSVKSIACSTDFPHELILISGVATGDDVMRGEETQIVGSMEGHTANQFIIHPGTHSKHITVTDGKVVDFRTYMTGEFFALLSKKSVLAGSVEETPDDENGFWKKSFEQGVRKGAENNLLHAAFGVRINDLFKELSAKENYFYLSGLLIGYELSLLAGRPPRTIRLIGKDSLNMYYATALKFLGITQDIQAISSVAATIRGQYMIYTSIFRNQI